MARPKCECRCLDGRPCRGSGAFLVGIGTRKLDRQWACGRHLARAVAAFSGAEGRDGQPVTVHWLPNARSRENYGQ